MNYKLLFILIEGNDDERFFESIIKVKFEKKDNFVVLWKYAQKRHKKIDNFLKSIKAMKASYIYVRDIHDTSNIKAKKEKIQNKFRNINKDKIIVVVKEIESWYLAGLDNANSKKLRVCSLTNTNTITKEHFDNLIPKKFASSRIIFMLEILNHFSTKTARKKNRSFNYFVNKYKL